MAQGEARDAGQPHCPPREESERDAIEEAEKRSLRNERRSRPPEAPFRWLQLVAMKRRHWGRQPIPRRPKRPMALQGRYSTRRYHHDAFVVHLKMRDFRDRSVSRMNQVDHFEHTARVPASSPKSLPKLSSSSGRKRCEPGLDNRHRKCRPRPLSKGGQPDRLLSLQIEASLSGLMLVGHRIMSRLGA